MKSSLVIIFNQDYSINIEKLEKLYSSRFDRIEYLVPTSISRLTNGFRKGKLPVYFYLLINSLIRFIFKLVNHQPPSSILNTDFHHKHKHRIHNVIGEQYFFYHYIAQSAKKLLESDSEWFWFVGDDAVLNSNITQDNFFSFLKIKSKDNIDAVLCEPIIATDEWLCKIQNNVESAENEITNLLGTSRPYDNKLVLEKEKASSSNENVSVACADFFGVRRDVLERSINHFNNAIRSRLFVEVCTPNILIYNANNPFSFSNFKWISQPSHSEITKMVKQLKNKDIVFAHPVKLSALSIENINDLL